MIKTKNGNISVEDFTQICKESKSVREVVQKLGYAPNGGGTAKRIKELIIQNSIDISHFNGQGHTKNIGRYRTPIEEYLTNKVKIGQPIPLELHHKNGDKEDNQLENLELRCPNCHYFTETYKTKNWSTQNNESAE